MPSVCLLISIKMESGRLKDSTPAGLEKAEDVMSAFPDGGRLLFMSLMWFGVKERSWLPL